MQRIVQFWEKVPNHPTYLVSDLGNVRRESGRLLSPSTINGYKKIWLPRLEGQASRTQHFVHRLVYIAHVGAIPDGMQINHINGDKTDNRLENLELVTPRENILHAVREGLIPSGVDAWPARNPHRMARGDRHGSRTKPDSVLRGDAHWTRQKPHLVARGPKVCTNKLTDSQVLEIRRRRADGENLKTLAKTFGVSFGLISHICNRRVWKHLP